MHIIGWIPEYPPKNLISVHPVKIFLLIFNSCLSVRNEYWINHYCRTKCLCFIIRVYCKLDSWNMFGFLSPNNCLFVQSVSNWATTLLQRQLQAGHVLAGQLRVCCAAKLHECMLMLMKHAMRHENTDNCCGWGKSGNAARGNCRLAVVWRGIGQWKRKASEKHGQGRQRLWRLHVPFDACWKFKAPQHLRVKNKNQEHTTKNVRQNQLLDDYDIRTNKSLPSAFYCW